MYYSFPKKQEPPFRQPCMNATNLQTLNGYEADATLAEPENSGATV
jgi:hypothetical protein